MADRIVLLGSGASDNNELFDRGWSSNDNLTNITDTDIADTLSTTSYPASTVSIRRSSISETVVESSSMDSSTLVSDLTTVSCNTSMVSICETSSSSITSQET